MGHMNLVGYTEVVTVTGLEPILVYHVIDDAFVQSKGSKCLLLSELRFASVIREYMLDFPLSPLLLLFGP